MKHIWILLALAFCLFACKSKNTPLKTEDANIAPADTVAVATFAPANAVYYWKTTFSLTDDERRFMTCHNVTRLYLHLFDVVASAERSGDDVVPEPTLLFIDSIPKGIEIVPVVFIDNELFRWKDMLPYAQLIVNRIFAMADTHDFAPFSEIQLDCDWTQTTEKAFFAFLQAVTQQLCEHAKESHIRPALCVTVRLHQLRMTAPPADRGVLMCYNTGAIRDVKTQNSILAVNDVQAYIKSLADYPLPLDVAYPTFRWAVLFRKGEFVGIVREFMPDKAKLDAQHRYTVDGTQKLGNFRLLKDDIIRVETSEIDDILQARKLIEPSLKNYSIILYHLDEENLKQYNNNEISQIYNR